MYDDFEMEGEVLSDSKLEAKPVIDSPVKAKPLRIDIDDEDSIPDIRPNRSSQKGESIPRSRPDDKRIKSSAARNRSNS